MGLTDDGLMGKSSPTPSLKQGFPQGVEEPKDIRIDIKLRPILRCVFKDLRVAQLGRALAWGARGRWFKSSRADHL